MYIAVKSVWEQKKKTHPELLFGSFRMEWAAFPDTVLRVASKLLKQKAEYFLMLVTWSKSFK